MTWCFREYLLYVLDMLCYLVLAAFSTFPLILVFCRDSPCLLWAVFCLWMLGVCFYKFYTGVLAKLDLLPLSLELRSCKRCRIGGVGGVCLGVLVDGAGITRIMAIVTGKRGSRKHSGLGLSVSKLESECHCHADSCRWLCVYALEWRRKWYLPAT